MARGKGLREVGLGFRLRHTPSMGFPQVRFEDERGSSDRQRSKRRQEQEADQHARTKALKARKQKVRTLTDFANNCQMSHK